MARQIWKYGIKAVTLHRKCGSMLFLAAAVASNDGPLVQWIEQVSPKD